jgi:hypothetical protein
MPLRNPFKRISLVEVPEPQAIESGFRDADLVAAKPVDADALIEYQLSGMPLSLLVSVCFQITATNFSCLEINGSGVFLPVFLPRSAVIVL